MVSNTGDIPGTSGGGSFQTSLGSTAVSGESFDREGKIIATDRTIPKKVRRGIRSKSFYKEAGRVKKHQRSMKRRARRVSGRR